MPNTSNITNMPDLKKLFVYVNFTGAGDNNENLHGLKNQLKDSSRTKYPERVFYVANDGSIITHGQEFGISDTLREQINNLATDSVNFKSSIKNLTGIDVPVGVAAEITADSIIGKYVAKEILENKTIVAAKTNTAITVEESKDTAGTTTYTIGLDVDGKTIVANGGKLKTAVKLVKKYCADETPSVNSTWYDVKTAAPAGTSVHPVILLTDNADAILDIVDGKEFVTDGMLDSVSYDEANGILTFTWNGDSGKSSTPIDVKKLFQIENIHTDTKDYIAVNKTNPTDVDTPHKGDVKDGMCYEVNAIVDATDLTNLSTVTHNAKTDDTEENYVANLADDNAYTVATAQVSGLVDAKKIAAKIRAIDVAIAGVGNDAIAREKTIDDKIKKLREDLNKEVTDRGNVDKALYGDEIPVAGPTSTITGNAAAIATLNAGEDTAGSVAQKIAQKIKALKDSLDAKVTYQDEHDLVRVAVSQVDGVVVANENAVTVKTGALTAITDQDAEYTLAAPSDSGYTKAGGYKAKGLTDIAAADPALVTNQDAWIYGQCIKSQAVASIASDNNQYIKIVREDNQTKVAFEPWTEIHTIEELAKMDGAAYNPGN